MGKTFGATFRFLGVLVGGLSLFILTHNALVFGLSEGMSQIVEHYVLLTDLLFGWLEKPIGKLLAMIGWGLPASWKDLLVVYLVLGSAFYRARRRFHHKFKNDFGKLQEHLATQIFRAVLWPLFFSLFVALPNRTNAPINIRRPQQRLLNDPERAPEAEERYRERLSRYLRGIRQVLLRVYFEELTGISVALFSFLVFNAAV